jgi:DNA-binding transcriptional ArsR family regulator
MKQANSVSATSSAMYVKDAPKKKQKTKLKSPFNKITYQRNAGVYKILAHPVRLEILNILKMNDCTVEDLLRVIPLSKANMSQHLALLRYAGVVAAQKSGLYVIYHIVDPRIVEPCAIMRELRRDPR